MKYIRLKLLISISFCALLFNVNIADAQKGDFGFGIRLGEPTGITGKFAMGNDAIIVDLVSSSFGSPRLNVDYCWHINMFPNKQFNAYVLAGGVVGFGKSGSVFYRGNNKSWYYRESGIAIGGNTAFGINFMPKNSPFEIFAEIGVLMGLTPFGIGGEGGLGIRYYP